MEGEIAEAVEAVGDALGEAEEERRRLEREARNEAVRNLVLQGVAEASWELMEDVDKEGNEPQILFALGELATRYPRCSV